MSGYATNDIYITCGNKKDRGKPCPYDNTSVWMI
jgi:hypothetical protein